MNYPLLTLELRKNRLSAASVAAAFFVTLPVSRLVAGATGMEPAKALEAILLGWIIIGSPFAAALIASSAGAQTASQSSHEAEALLPVSPFRRAGASIAAASLLIAAVTALLVLTAWLLGELTTHLPSRDPAFSWGRPFWVDTPASPILIFVLVDALLSCWLLSYLIGSGVAGGLLGLSLTGASLFVAAIAGGLQAEYGDWGVRVLPALFWIAGGTITAKFAAAAVAAAWRERRTRLGAGGAVALAALLLFGPLTLAFKVRRTFARIDARIIPIGAEAAYYYQSAEGRFPRGRPALAAAGEAAALKSARGAIVLADARGVRRLIAAPSASLFDLLLEPYKTWIHDAWRDDMGTLWIERFVDPTTELWRVAGASAESLRMTDGGSFLMVAGIPLKHRFLGSKRFLVAPADDYFLHSDKASWFEGYAGYLSRRQRDTVAARPACDGRCLEAGGHRWKLPGAALGKDPVYPDEVAGRRAYLIPVRTRHGDEVALCRADGSVEIVWPHEHEPSGRLVYRGLPDGTLFAFGPARTLRAIGPDGRVAAPVSYRELASALPRIKSPQPALVRRSEGKVWLVWGGRLSVLDSGGRTTLSRPLPTDVRGVVPLKDGFLIETTRDTFVSDWNGALRRIENPR